VIVHVPAADAPTLAVGEHLTAVIDWERRHKLSRMHTALHLVTVVLPYPITGAAVGEDKGRVDFNLPEVPDAADVEAKLNALIEAGHPVSAEWITDAELEANPGLIKSMNVKPPMGQGRVRLVRIGDVDLQPCGGTHVANTREIGPLKLGKIEKKGAINRRVTVFFA
jgi:misacylated tRNA(Ala) deacylase